MIDDEDEEKMMFPEIVKSPFDSTVERGKYNCLGFLAVEMMW